MEAAISNKLASLGHYNISGSTSTVVVPAGTQRRGVSFRPRHLSPSSYLDDVAIAIHTTAQYLHYTNIKFDPVGPVTPAGVFTVYVFMF